MPEPFFEVGNVYEPRNGPRWEIRFQREGTAHFTPVRVDRNSAGLPHAYGRLSMGDEHVWTTMDRFAFDAWKVADHPAADEQLRDQLTEALRAEISMLCDCCGNNRDRMNRIRELVGLPIEDYGRDSDGQAQPDA